MNELTLEHITPYGKGLKAIVINKNDDRYGNTVEITYSKPHKKDYRCLS